MSKNILISGYYGFDNFGDDAILQVLAESIKRISVDAEITAISNNLEKIKKNYGIDSIYKFDFKSIIKRMKETDLFISGGGSLLQDVTSFKSLLYYLSLILIAIFFGKEVYIYAQGIGPINSRAGRILTKFALKRASVVTVRDEKSQKFLKTLGIESVLTCDPVWGIEISEKDGLYLQKDKINVGVQLRSWSSLTPDKLLTIAKALNLSFDVKNTNFVLVSLQDSLDFDVMKELEQVLKSVNPDMQVKFISDLSVSNAVKLMNNLDYLVAMRFHAILVALKAKIPTFALSYDPKVETLSVDSEIPYTKIEYIDEEKLKANLDEMIYNKDNYLEKIVNFSSQKELEARQNNELLSKILSEEY